MTTTPLYAALLGLFFTFLSVRTLLLRRKHKISLGDSGNDELIRAIRAHANFAKYIPLNLLLLSFVELNQAPGLLVHGLGLCLFLGRLIHAHGVSQLKEDFRYRVTGMALTLTPMIISSLYLGYRYFFV